MLDLPPVLIDFYYIQFCGFNTHLWFDWAKNSSRWKTLLRLLVLALTFDSQYLLLTFCQYFTDTLYWHLLAFHEHPSTDYTFRSQSLKSEVILEHLHHFLWHQAHFSAVMQSIFQATALSPCLQCFTGTMQLQLKDYYTPFLFPHISYSS